MRILQVSKADSYGGGASKVASELTELLNEQGHESIHLVSWTGGGYNEKRRSLYGRAENSIRRLHYYTKKVGFPEYIPYEYYSLSKIAAEFKPDIIHFHDLSSAISPLSLDLISKHYKVVWTLHDCSPFTGGCLYPMECSNYVGKCGGCPQSGNWPIDSIIDTTRLGQELKKYVHKKGRINLLAPSDWMAQMAESSNAVFKRPDVIENGVCTDTYNPTTSKFLRDESINSYRGLKVLIAAGDLKDERKGINYAVSAIEKLKSVDPLVIVVGADNPEIDERLKSFNRVFTGYISNPKEMSSYYAAADVFLFCSLADNMPLSILESLASGTPVVGFKTGGVVEMIENGENGYLYDQGDINGLVEGLKRFLNKDVKKSLSERSRAMCEERFSHAIQVSNHIDYYKKLLAD